MKITTQHLNDHQKLIDLATAISLSSIKNNSRVQLKMPSIVVKLLDQQFPNVNRSQLLTQAALELLIRKSRFDNPELEAWHSQEQYDLDDMFNYLKKRDRA